MLAEIKHALNTCPKDGTIYLAKSLSKKSGFFIADGHLLYLVFNFENIEYKSLKTDYLLLNTDIEIRSFDKKQTFISGRYNVLDFLPTDKGYDESNLESFVNLCVAHTEFMGGKAFVKFFFSLSELFQTPKDQQYKNLIGLFGELSFLKYLCETFSLDLSDRWHSGGEFDKYEISLKNKNIEIKTTSMPDENVTIKHSQLFNTDQNYLVVVCIEKSSSGKTLNQLIADMQKDPTHYNNYNFMLNVEREKKRVSPVAADNKKLGVKSIAVYKASDINPLVEIPECISHLSYRLDLSGKRPIPRDDWKTEFNES